MAKKNRNDQIFTPDKYVEDMLDRIGYVKNLVGKTVLENSCGQGNILVPIVNRYIEDAKIQGLSNKCIAESLSQNIIKYKLLFTDDDLDISVEYCGNTYYCEIRVTDYPGMKKKRPIVEGEKKEEWQKTGNVCGVLCFYKKQDIMNLYIYPDDERTEIVKLG